MKKILSILVAISFIAISCTKEPKKEQVSFKVSGMTCQVGCAKLIQSKLVKKEGVIKADVIFKDSVANIEYDANLTNKEDLMAFVGGLKGGIYKSSDLKNIAIVNDKKACCSGSKDSNGAGCGNSCSGKAKAVKTANAGCSNPSCGDSCASKPKVKKACSTNCTKPCCADKAKKTASAGCSNPSCGGSCASKAKTKKVCDTNCKKPCCADKVKKAA